MRYAGRAYKYLITITILAAGIFGRQTVTLGMDVKNDPLMLEKLVAEATENNPAITAAIMEKRAAELRVKPAGSLPDTSVSIGIQAVPVDTFALDEWDMTQKVFSITQPLPFPGKLRLMENVVEYDGLLAGYNVRILQDRVAFEVRKTFYEWAYSVEALRITRHEIKVIENFIEVATSRYAVGKGAQWDVLRAQVERSKMKERETTLTRKIEGYRIDMAALLGRDTAEGFPVEPVFGWTGDLSLDPEALVRRASDTNPSLGYLRATIGKSRAVIELADKNRLPDFSVTLTYGQRDNGEMDGMTRDRPDFVSGIFGIKIPMNPRRSRQPLVESARHSESAATKKLESETLRIKSLIRDRVLAIQRAVEVEKLYRTGILPQAKTTVESAMANYRVDKVDFLTLLNSEITLINYELDYYRVRIDREIALANIEMLVGAPIAEKAETGHDDAKVGEEDVK